MCACACFAADWQIHGALGLNPWVNFQRVSPDGHSIQIETFMYGTDADFLVNSDQWLLSDTSGWVTYTNGLILSVSSDWITTEIAYNPDYGTSSYLFWFIEGGAPDFLGGSSAVAPSVAGEYWIDFDTTGSIRISNSQPLDFGKWTWDGSINPNYVLPLKTKGHKKH